MNVGKMRGGVPSSYLSIRLERMLLLLFCYKQTPGDPMETETPPQGPPWDYYYYYYYYYYYTIIS